MRRPSNITCHVTSSIPTDMPVSVADDKSYAMASGPVPQCIRCSFAGCFRKVQADFGSSCGGGKVSDSEITYLWWQRFDFGLRSVSPGPSKQTAYAEGFLLLLDGVYSPVKRTHNYLDTISPLHHCMQFFLADLIRHLQDQ